MNAGQVAALIAAVFFAAGVCVASYALIKLARLTTETIRYVTGTRERTDLLIEQAQAAIDRTNEQLARTDAITANMTQVSADVAELTEQVSALAGLGRALVAGPVGKAAAVAYGVRHAVALRRPDGGARMAAPAAVAGQRSAFGLRAGSTTPGLDAGSADHAPGGGSAGRAGGARAIGRPAR